LFYFDGETALVACVLKATTEKRSTFWRRKVHPGDLAGGFSDLEMTWLLYCAGAATEKVTVISFDCETVPIPTEIELCTLQTLPRCYE